MRFPPRIKTDKEMGRPDRRLAGVPREPDCDLCRECKEHAEFEENEDGEVLSNCCGAPAYSAPEWDPYGE